MITRLYNLLINKYTCIWGAHSEFCNWQAHEVKKVCGALTSWSIPVQELLRSGIVGGLHSRLAQQRTTLWPFVFPLALSCGHNMQCEFFIFYLVLWSKQFSPFSSWGHCDSLGWVTGTALYNGKARSLHLNPDFAGSKAYVPFTITLPRPSTHVAFLQLRFHFMNPLLYHS